MTFTSSSNLLAQDYYQIERAYYPGFPFVEGLYLKLDEFIENQPPYQGPIERKGADLYIQSDSSNEMILVNPNKVWGFSLGTNVYIAYDEGYWRLINIGRLSHFTAIVVTSFQTIDAFGFPTTQYSKTLQHLFVDTDSGEIYALTEKQLKPFLEKDPLLLDRFEKMRKKKMADLIKVLKAYNELYPLEFPIHE